MSYQLTSTSIFDKWFDGLKDRQTKNKVLARLDRVANGNFGDNKAIGGDLYELRFFFGAGLRIYYTIRCGEIVLLLAGGNKSTQSRDVQKAKDILEELE